MFSTNASWPCNTIYSCSCCSNSRTDTYFLKMQLDVAALAAMRIQHGESNNCDWSTLVFSRTAFWWCRLRLLVMMMKLNMSKKGQETCFFLVSNNKHTAHKTHRYDSFMFHPNDHDVNSRNTLFFEILYLTFFDLFSLCANWQSCFVSKCKLKKYHIFRPWLPFWSVWLKASKHSYRTLWGRAPSPEIPPCLWPCRCRFPRHPVGCCGWLTCCVPLQACWKCTAPTAPAAALSCTNTKQKHTPEMSDCGGDMATGSHLTVTPAKFTLQHTFDVTDV